jgi:pyridoxal phosphate enzyme (YggS family)
MTNDWTDSWTRVSEQIRQAEASAGRPAHAVRLLAVSKTFPVQAVLELAEATGQRDFGENYVQEGLDKIAATRGHALARDLVWHCIGPLQSNKTRAVAEHFHWVHSVDRLRIAQRLSEQRPAQLPPLQVCLQVNIDGGPTKSGVSPDQALVLAQAVAQLPRLHLRGLMTSPDPLEGFEAQRAVHLKAHALFEALGRELNSPDWDTLSMGMSADLQAAIHAGSTMVRVGTALFGPRLRGDNAFPVQS